MIIRLYLDVTGVKKMAEGLRQIVELPDPIREIQNLHYRQTAIQGGKMRVPLGVACMIYESRPNVTADADGLCLKSGNTVILMGGSVVFYSNKAIIHCIHNGLRKVGLPV